MDTSKGAFGSGGVSSADIAAMQKDLADLKAITGANVVTITPAEGGAYTIPATERTISIVNAEPATDLNAVTINLPTARVGQRLFFHSLKQIASVSFAMPGGTVDNWQVMLSPGDSVDFTYTKTNNWSRSV